MVRSVALAFLLLWPALVAAEPGRITKAVPLRQEPSAQAPALRTLASDTQIEILKAERWWMQVRAGDAEGWVPVFYVQGGALQAKASAGSEAAGVVGLVTGRQGSGQVTSVIGVRGLNEEDLKGAHFSPGELQSLESYAAGRDEAERYAGEVPLEVQRLDYIQAPVAQGGGFPGEQ